MIKEGQVYQLKENPNNRIVIKSKQSSMFFEVQTINGSLYPISEYSLSKNYHLTVEYNSFEEAIASPEFRGKV